MAGENETGANTMISMPAPPGSPEQSEPPPQTESQSPPTAAAPDNRVDLLSRARTFLMSPQIREQDISAKRRFLMEKGLDELEIEGLLRELPVYVPAIPPRTYPQPPPSNLPNLLMGLVRLFSWIAGGSAALVFIYYRFLLPRIARTSHARHSIKSHHLSLMRKLTTSLASLKESQAESLASLPRPEPYTEAALFAACHSTADVLKELGDKGPGMEGVPPVTLLRCGIEDFAQGKDGDNGKPTTEELFQYLEGHIPWLVTEEGLKYEQILWETLSTCPLFTGAPTLPPSSQPEGDVEEQRLKRWTYIAPAPASPSALLASLTALSSSMPRSSTTERSAHQHTLQSLSGFTGYISTQVYAPYRPPVSAMGFAGTGSPLGPAEEELRREIRALKGLVLNRRSFMPAMPRPGVSPVPVATP